MASLNKIIVGFIKVQLWRRFDWGIVLAGLLLSLVSLAALYSLAVATDSPVWDNLIRQSIALALGLVVFLFFAIFDYKIFERYAYWIYGGGLLLLIGVLIFGTTLRGTQGWFVIGPFNFQPVEALKIILVITLARFFSQQSWPLNQLRHFVLAGLLTAVPVVLVLLQPDFGSAFLLILIWSGFVVAIGPRPRHLLLFAGLAIMALLIGWYGVFAPYQKDRLATFVNPAADPLGTGYNVNQSMIAIGSGQLWGRGLGFGSQSQLNFLPAAQTDFIFAVIAEGLGLLGVFLTLALFFLLLSRLLNIAKKTHDNFGLFLVVGIIALLFSQIVLNIAVTLGIAPVTGVTLPLISYGGSSLILTFAMLGIAQSVYRRS